MSESLIHGASDRGQRLARIVQACQQCREQPSTNPAEANVAEWANDLLQALGFKNENICRQFGCGDNRKADLAARFQPLEGPKSFNVSPKDPDLIVEVKRPKNLFSSNHKDTIGVVEQLTRYLRSKPCRTARYGLIFNGCELQLFRKHGALVYPITAILTVADGQIDATVAQLEKHLKADQSPVGTIITVWNNKGGVGKTTTAQSLALLLSDTDNERGTRNKVLIIDFDHNQGDLTANFGLEPSDGGTEKLLESMLLDPQGPGDDLLDAWIHHHQIPKGFRRRSRSIDILPADRKLNASPESYRQSFIAQADHPLRKLCEHLAKRYDYVLIDAPPNYESNIFAQEAVKAADCLLPIAHFLEPNSIRNYARLVVEKFAEAQQQRNDGGPYSLGMWFNRWKATGAQQQATRRTVDALIQAAEPGHQDELRRIFLHRSGGSASLRRIEECHDIARSIMEANRLAGVLRFSRARNAYDNLLKTFVD